jgi:hypothetical protein
VIILQVDSYEPYHIGSKLNPATNFDVLKSKLKEKLGAAGYSVKIEVEDEENYFIKNPVEVLATKNNTKIEFHKIAEALNVIGTQPEKVSEIFKETMATLVDLEYEIENLVVTFEILATIIVKADDKPLNALNQSVSIDSNSFPVDDVQNWNVTGIRVGGENSLKNTFFSVMIEPNPTSPNTKFRAKLQYQSRKKENVHNFSENLDFKIINLMKQLG